MSQLQGIFNDKLTFPDFDHAPFSYFHLPIEDDFILHVTDDSCARMDKVTHFVKADPNTIKMIAQFDLFLAESFYPRLRKLTNMPDASDITMADVANYLYWAQYSNLNLKFDLTEEDNDYINVVMNESKYWGRIANDELWQMPTFEFLNQFSEFVNVIND